MKKVNIKQNYLKDFCQGTNLRTILGFFSEVTLKTSLISPLESSQFLLDLDFQKFQQSVPTVFGLFSIRNRIPLTSYFLFLVKTAFFSIVQLIYSQLTIHQLKRIYYYPDYNLPVGPYSLAANSNSGALYHLVAT